MQASRIAAMCGCCRRPVSEASFMNCWRLISLMVPPSNSLASSTLSATSLPEKVSSALNTVPELPLPRHSMSANLPIREDQQRIGKFALIECLGKGSSGTVFKALDTFSGNEVALKVLDAKLFEGGTINEMSRQQFMNEASLTGRLQHPHIAAILEACIDDKSGYIAVEY